MTPGIFLRVACGMMINAILFGAGIIAILMVPGFRPDDTSHMGDGADLVILGIIDCRIREDGRRQFAGSQACVAGMVHGSLLC